MQVGRVQLCVRPVCAIRRSLALMRSADRVPTRSTSSVALLAPRAPLCCPSLKKLQRHRHLELRSPLGLLSVGPNCARVLVSSARRDGGQEMARVLFAILLGVGVAACAQPKTTEWAGIISGGGERCTSFRIEIFIDKDGGIAGEAALHRTKKRPRSVWDVSGRVDKSNSVKMWIEDIGPVWLTLVGHLTGSSLSIAQPASRRCDPPRSGVLKRL